MKLPSSPISRSPLDKATLLPAVAPSHVLNQKNQRTGSLAKLAPMGRFELCFQTDRIYLSPYE